MFKTFSTMTFLGLLGLSAVRAQAGQGLEAKIPFEFTVRNASLPAGTYNVKYDNTTQVLSIRGWRLGAAATTEVPNARAKGPSELIFHCYNRACHLAEVSEGAGGEALKIPQGPQEHQVMAVTRAVLMTARVK